MEYGQVDGILYPRSFVRALGSLVYLRYLSVSCVSLSFIPSIQNMVLLQTLKLDVFNTVSIPSWLSRNILGKLGHLRYLYLPPIYDRSRPPKKQKLRFDGLGRLETLENFSTVWCEAKDLPKLINLQRLTLEVDDDYGDVKETLKNLSSSSNLRYLGLSLKLYKQPVENVRGVFWDYSSILQKLSISGRLEKLAQLFENQPRNLINNHVAESSIRITSLTLQFSLLEDDPMPVLEKIPSLRKLDLSVNSFVGKEMFCSSMGFPKLTSLELWQLPNLVKWNIEEGSMSVLTKLEIISCPMLEELPEGLIFLTSLHSLWLGGMHTDFIHKIRTVNGNQGEDFYRVAHVPVLSIS
ncbi:probable disease resistance protein RF9 [Daucus carota subsp. sativus]|uniref:probable disease resistance protein RF9 n=1 Tax=Daucus carota subsp. sativus TaxID=79200 RepID=UPI003082F9B2